MLELCVYFIYLSIKSPYASKGWKKEESWESLEVNKSDEQSQRNHDILQLLVTPVTGDDSLPVTIGDTRHRGWVEFFFPLSEAVICTSCIFSTSLDMFKSAPWWILAYKWTFKNEFLEPSFLERNSAI